MTFISRALVCADEVHIKLETKVLGHNSDGPHVPEAWLDLDGAEPLLAVFLSQKLKH